MVDSRQDYGMEEGGMEEGVVDAVVGDQSEGVVERGERGPGMLGATTKEIAARLRNAGSGTDHPVVLDRSPAGDAPKRPFDGNGF